VRADLDWGTVARLGRSLADRLGDGEAVVDGSTRLSWAQLGAAGEAAARAFVAAGVAPGDRVSIWAPNSAGWVVALLGVHQAGAVLVPLNTRLRGAEAADILRRSRARLLLTVSGFLGNDYVGMLAGHDLPDLAPPVVLRGEAPAGAVAWADFLAAGAGVDPAEVAARVARLSPEDPSDVIFTSGTTGAPKGVVATHAQTLRAYGEWASIVGLERGDRYLMANPMFHTFGYKAGIVASMLVGATMVPLPVFDADAVLAAVAAEGITVMPGPPTLYQTLLAHPGLAGADLSTLRLAVTGAASIPLDLVRRMGEELGIATVLTAYGLTEATGFVTACRRGDPAEIVAGTSGRAISDVEVRVVDGAGEPAPAGTAGEIVTRGYHVMHGYLDDPAETARAIDAEGWLHTGDIGVMDGAGNLRVTDRLKDMFIVGGFNAYPAEIESLLCQHPEVAQAAVVGVPDGRLGEVGVAFVVAAGDLDVTSLLAWAREHMANYKVPRQVHVLEALPLNASGKVLKYELRRRALA
jgi:acyl-CoA synthetase (AMP-forming)/AMP-acid ligase II